MSKSAETLLLVLAAYSVVMLGVATWTWRWVERMSVGYLLRRCGSQALFAGCLGYESFAHGDSFAGWRLRLLTVGAGIYALVAALYLGLALGRNRRGAGGTAGR